MATTYILAGWLIDGSGEKVREKMLLKIEAGRFAAIEQYRPDSGVDTSRLTDLSHCTILPPLVDCHMHLFMSGTIDQRVREAQLTAGFEELRPVMARHLADLFSHGVLAARDGGDPGDFALRFRKEMGVPAEMILKLAGRAWHRQGRYGRLVGKCPAEGEPLDLAFVRDEGSVDVVKVMQSGLNSLKVFGRETAPQFTLEELAGLVRVASAKGLKVMVHANGREPVRLAIEAGCHSIEHGFFMGRDNLSRMAEKGTFWVPTAFTMKAYAANIGSAGPAVDRRVVEKNLDDQLAQLAFAREQGVNVALGTDAGSPGVLHGESVVEEMKLFIKAGYSLPEAIRCATANGARLLGLDDFGLLAKGRAATFLVARGGPALLPRKLGYLEGIYLNGSPSPLYRKNPVKHVRGRAAE